MCNKIQLDSQNVPLEIWALSFQEENNKNKYSRKQRGVYYALFWQRTKHIPSSDFLWLKNIDKINKRDSIFRLTDQVAY